MTARLDHTLEGLQAGLSVDEGAGRFRERCDGQEHVGVLNPCVTEGGEGHDQAGALQGGLGRSAVCGVELWLYIEHEQGLHRLAQHLAGVQGRRGPRGRLSADQLGPDTVGRSPQESHTRAGMLSNEVGQLKQRSGLRVLFSPQAHQHGRALAAQQRLGHRRGLFTGFDTRHWRRHSLGLRDRSGHSRQGSRPMRRCGGDGVAHGHEPVVTRRPQTRHLSTAPCSLAQPLGKQRMVFAQKAAHHQHAVQGGQLGNRHTQPCGLGGATGIGLP